MDLQADAAPAGDGVVRLHVVHRLPSVDPQLDPRPLGENPVPVPAVPIERLLDHGGLRPREHAVASRLVVQAAPPRRIADVEVRRRILAVRGISQVVSIGGDVKQYQILVDPLRIETVRSFGFGAELPYTGDIRGVLSSTGQEGSGGAM